MNGINLLLNTYSITRTSNISNAIAELNKLELTAGTCNHYIREAVRLEDGEELEVSNNATLSRNVLKYLVQASFKTGNETFSLAAYNELAERARAITPAEAVKSEPINVAPVTVTAAVSEPVAAVVKNPIVEIIAKPVAVVTDGVKRGRGRKADPNNKGVQSKRLYDEAVDKSRDVMVARFVAELGIPAGSALTYWYNARK